MISVLTIKKTADFSPLSYSSSGLRFCLWLGNGSIQKIKNVQRYLLLPDLLFSTFFCGFIWNDDFKIIFAISYKLDFINIQLV